MFYAQIPGKNDQVPSNLQCLGHLRPYWEKVDIYIINLPHTQNTYTCVTSLIKRLLRENRRNEPLPLAALPTVMLYVASPPWLFVLMSIVQSLSIRRLSRITEHFFEPKVMPLVKKLSRSFPTRMSISVGWYERNSEHQELNCFKDFNCSLHRHLFNIKLIKTCVWLFPLEHKRTFFEKCISCFV